MSGARRTDLGREARSPPGQWRILLPALFAWAAVAWAVVRPGAASWIVLAALFTGGILLVGWAFALYRGSSTVRRSNGDVAPASGGRFSSGCVQWLRVTLLGLAVLALLSGRVLALEHVRAAPDLMQAAQLGHTLPAQVTLTGYPRPQTSGFGERLSVAGSIATDRGRVPVELRMRGTAPGDWGPGRVIEGDVRVTLLAAGELAAYRLTADADAGDLGDGGAVAEAVAQADASAGAGSSAGAHAELVSSESRSGVRTLAEAGIGARVFAWLGRLAAQLRSNLHGLAETVSGASLVPGFAVGDTSLVSERLAFVMRESSLTHLTAVSGANCALVTGAVLFVSRRLGIGRRARALGALAALASFVVLVGPDASVQRAAVMAAVLLASHFGGRRSLALPALGLAVIVLLAIDPWQAVQAGFALSVTATAGILLMATPLTRWLERRARLPKPLALAIAVAAAAQFACGPLLILLQPSLPAVGIAANVFAGVAAPLGTGLGLIALIGGAIHPLLGYAAVVAASVPARFVEFIAETASGLPFARWYWVEGWEGTLLLAATESLLVVAWAIHRGHLGLPGGHRVEPRVPWEPRRDPARRVLIARAVTLSAALALFVGISVLTPISMRLGTPKDWIVVACDVGQGDAVLLRDPRDPANIMLVDTGADRASLRACLDRFGVRKIRLLVLTHDDADHVAALDEVLPDVAEALISPDVMGEAESLEDRAVVQALKHRRVPYTIAAAGMEGGFWGSASQTEPSLHWSVLAPRPDARPLTANSASIVMRVEIGSYRALLLGDTGEAEQQALRDTPEIVSAEIVKTAHHGSRDQDHHLAELVGAHVSLISVGAANRYGHPHPDTLRSLEEAGTVPLRTDLAGSIALSPRPGPGCEALRRSACELRVWVERKPPTLESWQQ